MGDIYLFGQGAPSAPSAGDALVWFDSASGGFFYTDENGRAWGQSHNAAIADQGAGFATDTYVTNSGILIPSFGLQAKTLFMWEISASKTNAGTVAPIYSLRIGSNQSTADTARLQLTGAAQTASADVGILTVMATVRSVGGSGVIQGTAGWSDNVSSGGFASGDGGYVEGASAGFDNSDLGGQYIGLSINGGTSAAWTITQVMARAIW